MDKKRLQNLSFRQAHASDAPQLYQVLVTSVRTLCAGDYTQAQLETVIDNSNVEFYERVLTQGSMTIVVAEIGGSVVGFASLCRSTIGDLFVHPLHIKQGVGTRLLNAIEMEAVLQNIKKLRVSASLTACRFYQARGYCIIKPSFITNSQTGIRVPCIDLEKWLPEAAKLMTKETRSRITKKANRYRHPKDSRVATPVFELTPVALAQSFTTWAPSKTASEKSAPVTSTLSKRERSIIASAKTASLKSAPVKSTKYAIP